MRSTNPRSANRSHAGQLWPIGRTLRQIVPAARDIRGVSAPRMTFIALLSSSRLRQGPEHPIVGPEIDGHVNTFTDRPIFLDGQTNGFAVLSGFRHTSIESTDRDPRMLQGVQQIIQVQLVRRNRPFDRVLRLKTWHRQSVQEKLMPLKEFLHGPKVRPIGRRRFDQLRETDSVCGTTDIHFTEPDGLVRR